MIETVLLIALTQPEYNYFANQACYYLKQGVPVGIIENHLASQIFSAENSYSSVDHYTYNAMRSNALIKSAEVLNSQIRQWNGHIDKGEPGDCDGTYQPSTDQP